MRFSQKKLPRSAALDLRRVSLETLKPYELMVAPIYVYLQKNQKFLAVKGPLDFFSPKEIEQIQIFGAYFVTKFVDSLTPFESAAVSTRALLSWQGDSRDPAQLPPSPYELSDAVLKVVAPFWGDQGQIEPFFIFAFVNRLCRKLDSEILVKAREQGMDAFEMAVLRSSLGVFLALHLGFCNLEFLNFIRREFFCHFVGVSRNESPEYSLELSELRTCVEELIKSVDSRFIFRATFSEIRLRSAHKLKDRLQRLGSDIQVTSAGPFSIYGSKGFIDV